MPFGFTPQLDDRILSDLESLLKKVPKPWYAAFDADGTLWDTDVGEMFFRYQIQHCGLPDLPADPWAHYCEMKETQYRDACIWLAQINRGQKISQVQQWAHTNVHRNTPLPVFSAQKNLIKFLISREVKVVIVTASIQWAVEPAAHAVGLSPQDVMGITTKVSGGLVTDEAVEPVTWREGKQTAILKYTNGIHPILCAGNSTGDTMLLQCSQGVRLAVCSSKNQSGELFESEQKLQKQARENSWHQHTF